MALGDGADAAPVHFEVGPIRPPNEANSLLVRVTRNCPHNHCTFCPVYKGRPFSERAPEEVEADIQAMAGAAERIRKRIEICGVLNDAVVQQTLAEEPCEGAIQVLRFVATGERTAFLQDANSLVMSVDDLERVLKTLRAAFPSLERVTTYARSKTVAASGTDELERLCRAGLDRVHIGMESGADRVLKRAAKGVTATEHIEAGCAVKAAGLELSEYVMPGLGGRDLSEAHAEETARALCAIDPHFIRLRTLAIASGTPLDKLHKSGRFEPLDDVGVAREIRALLVGLEGCTGTLRSDHVLNLLEEVSGKLPEALPALIAVVDRFLGMDAEERDLFVVARRLGIVRCLDDLEAPGVREQASTVLRHLRERYPGPLDVAIRALMSRFV
ncbi:MAG: radical SAM protein [Deltaproteobacteria bacterium]|nr:radical SAM protein [Deltaproteobacteria bacterium]